LDARLSWAFLNDVFEVIKLGFTFHEKIYDSKSIRGKASIKLNIKTAQSIVRS